LVYVKGGKDCIKLHIGVSLKYSNVLFHITSNLSPITYSMPHNNHQHLSAPQPIASTPAMPLADFQSLIRRMYLEKDIARGVEGTFMWFMEEVGELASALRNGTHEECVLEFADVLAWLTTMANVVGVDLTEAVMKKYGTGCPGCGRFVCTCPNAGKP
jgi:NTP pyrophosphatase (non-canonical NTP hydrolase)